jgi:cob(I)alamin adenosyltransferase
MNFLATIDEQKGVIRDLKKELRGTKDTANELAEFSRKTTLSKDQNQTSLSIMTIRAEELDLDNRILREQLAELRDAHELLQKESEMVVSTLQTQLGKRELEVSKLQTKVETLLERNHEYLEKLDAVANAKNLATEIQEEKHSGELKRLNELNAALKKELEEVKLQKLFLEKGKVGGEGHQDNSFRVLGGNGDAGEPVDLGSEIGNISLRGSIRKGETDKPSAESLEMEQLRNLKNDLDSLDNDREASSPTNDKKLLETMPIRSRNSSIGRTAAVPKRKMSTENNKVNGLVDNRRGSRNEPLKTSGFASSGLRKTFSPGPGEFVTGPSDITDLCKDIDDPILEYIAELEEKNMEIHRLRTELMRYESDGAVIEAKKTLVTLQLEVKHLKENLAQAERIHAEEIAFHKQQVDEVTEALTATKIRLSTMASERDTLVLNFNRRIKRLNYQISIYETQISAFNDSYKARQESR